MSLGIRKNDTVVVLAGKDKGKTGRILAINTGKGRVIVEKVNMIKKHMKPSKAYAQGGIIDKEASLDKSNVMIVCPKCDKPTRIAAGVVEGSKSRVCKKCKEVIDK
ncbi:MAG: 50S ribosomal protein L24 [Nitrospirae bacterium]|jgi:large subunit ribosomal protein L24|nr:50S ribosomal protein L24 [Nitrospirota bacterium]